MINYLYMNDSVIISKWLKPEKPSGPIDYYEIRLINTTQSPENINSIMYTRCKYMCYWGLDILKGLFSGFDLILYIFLIYSECLPCTCLLQQQE